MFCKYLRNESSDLHEILCGGQLLSCDHMYQISFRLVHKCACTSCKRARARFIAITRVYNSCARIYAQIWMKFDTYDHKIVNDHHIKFHEDLSFRRGDIFKTILVFFNPWFSMYFWYFRNYAAPKPSKMDIYWMLVEFFWN